MNVIYLVTLAYHVFLLWPSPWTDDRDI